MAKIQCLSCGGMTDIGNAASGECLYCGCRVSLRRISAFSPVSRTELPQLKAAAEKESGENPDAELALALCYLKSGNFALAKKRLAALIETCPEYAEVHRLMKFLSYFTPVSDKDVPATSLLRGFIGGSSL